MTQRMRAEVEVECRYSVLSSLVMFNPNLPR